jgi:hypothetical protein
MMSQFDYLIRSGSHFPWVAQIIGNHKGIIFPIEYNWQQQYLKINRVAFIQPDRENHNIKETIISCDKNETTKPLDQIPFGSIVS